MKVELISYTKDAARLCGEAAAVCTNSMKPERSLRHSMSSGHESVLEHAVFSFRVDGLSRAALAQLTRHRLASFDVQSQRYVRIGNVNMVMPESIRTSDFRTKAAALMAEAMTLYQWMVAAGIPSEDARYITPQAMPTSLIMTMNARELRHFFRLRCCNRAQWEIRQLADEMLRICKGVAPVLFENAGPDCVTGKCAEKKPCGTPRDKVEWS